MISGDKDGESCSQSTPNGSVPGFLSTANASIERQWISEESRRPQALSYSNASAETIVIGLIDEHSFTRRCISRFLQESVNTFEIISFFSCEDLLKTNERYNLFLYHHTRQVTTSNSGHTTFVEIKNLAKIAPVIVLSQIDCHDLLLHAFEYGARGFIPTASTTPEQVIEIIRLINAGGTFVPPSSLALRRINQRASILPPITTDQFTSRELAVLDRLTLGSANKAIAHELQMSESTVKVHITNIMTKLKARNRTEVVCLAYDLMNWRAPSSGSAMVASAPG